MFGGMFIGLCEAFSISYISSRYGDLFVFAILIVVMLVRPTGLFGQKPLQKV
jgi:branched-chain amino acid transport system permease protein